VQIQILDGDLSDLANLLIGQVLVLVKQQQNEHLVS